jgi:thiamine-phosphate diphosphorylase
VNPEQLSLYLVTDPVLCGNRGVEDTCRLALQAGVGTLQLRDKNASTRELIHMAVVLKDLCRNHGVLFVVNDRIDVAMAVGADGVHLGQDDMPVHLARKILGAHSIIGASVRSPREAAIAYKEGADYIAANLIFPTDTKTDLGEPLGIEAISKLKKASPLPLVAIGGINPSNADAVRKAGADGIAVVSAIMAAEDVPLAVAQLSGTYHIKA